MKELRIQRLRGLSLVEMMISLAIGAVLTIGVVSLFTANSETYNALQGQTRLQENAGFALETLSRDLQKAGYRGCFSSGSSPYFTMTSASGIPYESDLRTGIELFDANGDGSWTPSTASLNAAVTGAAFFDTDLLTVRYLDDDEAYLNVALATSIEDITVSITDEGLETLAVGDIAAIHDCEKATLFRVTGRADAGGVTTLQHAVGASPEDNGTLALAETGTFSTNAAVSGIITRTYFIGPGAGTNNEGNAPLSLWRRENDNNAVELVEGVENFQLQLAIDTDGDSVPNQYVAPSSAVNFSQVMAVVITITTNSVDAIGGTTAPTWGCAANDGELRTAQDCFSGTAIDGLLRRSFTRTIQIRNQT